MNISNSDWDVIRAKLDKRPALAKFIVQADGLERIENMFSLEIKAIEEAQKPKIETVDQVQVPKDKEPRRRFPTGRDPRWPSKREQNGWST